MGFWSQTHFGNCGWRWFWESKVGTAPVAQPSNKLVSFKIDLKKCNILTGYDYKKIFKAVMYFNKNKIKAQKIFGDGEVSDRILNTLKKINKS